jgi:hypothetical protein
VRSVERTFFLLLKFCRQKKLAKKVKILLLPLGSWIMFGVAGAVTTTEPAISDWLLTVLRGGQL